VFLDSASVFISGAARLMLFAFQSPEVENSSETVLNISTFQLSVFLKKFFDVALCQSSSFDEEGRFVEHYSFHQCVNVQAKG
jgi:hypothetical protein